MSNFKPPKPMDFGRPNWEQWKQNFEMYKKISGLEEKTEEIQVTTLKYTMGIGCEEILRTMNLTAEEQGKL